MCVFGLLFPMCARPTIELNETEGELLDCPHYECRELGDDKADACRDSQRAV